MFQDIKQCTGNNVTSGSQLTNVDLQWKEYPLIHGSHDVSRDLQRHRHRHLTSDYTVTIDTPINTVYIIP